MKREMVTFISVFAGAGWTALLFGGWQRSADAGGFMFFLLIFLAYIRTIPRENHERHDA